MSRAERFAFSGALALLVLHAVVFAWPGVGAALEYRRAVLNVEPWRLLTGHWVHINWPHALVNAVAWFVVARLFAPELPPLRQLVALVSASVAIGIGLAIAFPAVDWYRGFSGVLHALFFAGATAWLLAMLARRESRSLRMLWLPGALIVGGWIKVLLEQPPAGAVSYAEWLGAATVPQAHLLGAAWGVLLGAVFARASGAAAAVREQHE